MSSPIINLASGVALGVIAFLFLINVSIFLARITGMRSTAELISKKFAPLAHLLRLGNFPNGDAHENGA